MGTSWLTFRFRAFDRLVDGRPVVLIRDGQVVEGVLRKYRITDSELRTALHQHGLLAVGEVRRAFVEPNGDITMIKHPGE